MKNILKTLTLSSLVALTASFAQATDAQNSLQVEITISTGCTVNFPNNSGNVNFGTYARISSTLIETREVVVDCNGATSTNTTTAGRYSLTLNEGLNSAASGAFAQGRKMVSGTNYIAYDVHQAVNLSSRSCTGTRWDVSNPFTGTIAPSSGTMAGSASHYFAVCIPVPTTQPAAGVYTDALVATLTY